MFFLVSPRLAPGVIHVWLFQSQNIIFRPAFSAKMSNYYCQNEFGKGFDAKDKFKF